MGARPLPSGALSTEDRPRHKLLDKLEERRASHRERSRIIRILYAAVGVTLFVGGIAMLVLPGPAFAVIPIGLFILALEFTWAERALETALDRAERARAKAADTTTTQRVLTGVAAALAAAGVAVWAVLGDIPIVPV